MVPKIPSCHYMLLMQPSWLKFIGNQFHILYTCKITTATGWQPSCSKWILLLFRVSNTRIHCLWTSSLGTQQHGSPNFGTAKGHTRCCGLVWWSALGQLTINSVYDCLNYCVVFMICTQFTNVAAGRVIYTLRAKESRGPLGVDPYSSASRSVNVAWFDVTTPIDDDDDDGGSCLLVCYAV
jgi:hypothetical protein